MTGLFGEYGANLQTRTYDGALQLTRIQGGGGVDLSYTYPATQNDGRILA